MKLSAVSCGEFSILKERSIIIRSLTPQQVTGNVLATEFKIMTDKPGEPRKLHHIAKDIGRLIWCAVGVATGIGLVLWFVRGPSSPFLLASLDGSSVFLFGLPRAAATQPRVLFGGHLGSALIGIFCFHSFGDALWVYMLATKTVHPPAGANPLIIIHEHAGFLSLWKPVGLGIVILALVAVVWSRFLPGTNHYPTNWFAKSPPSILWGGWSK